MGFLCQITVPLRSSGHNSQSLSSLNYMGLSAGIAPENPEGPTLSRLTGCPAMIHKITLLFKVKQGNVSKVPMNEFTDCSKIHPDLVSQHYYLHQCVRAHARTHTHTHTHTPDDLDATAEWPAKEYVHWQHFIPLINFIKLSLYCFQVSISPIEVKQGITNQKEI